MPIEAISTNDAHAVVWSGGCDSTLVADLVGEHCAKQGKRVRLISCDAHFLHGHKLTSEQRVREKALAILRKRHGDIFDHTIVTTQLDNAWLDTNTMDETRCAQPPLFAFQVLPYLPAKANVYFGYVLGDGFWQLNGFFYHGVTNLAEMLGRTLTLAYPLRLARKSEIIQELHNRKLYTSTWYCEMPPKPNVVCGRCMPCVTHLAALHEVMLDGETWATKPYQKLAKAFQGV